MERQESKKLQTAAVLVPDISIRYLNLKSSEFEYHVVEFEKWLRVLGYAKSTVYYFPFYVKSFLHFLEQKDILEMNEIHVNHVSLFIQHLSRKKNKRTNQFLSPNYLYNHINALKRFSRYLREYHGILFDASIRLAKGTTKEPKWLTIEEIKRLYSACNKGLSGDYDRAILAIYYGLGLRRSEGKSINISDIHFAYGLVHVRKGKNNKERFVPMSLKVQKDLRNYITGFRSIILKNTRNKEEDSLFISSYGTRLTANSIYNKLQCIAKNAGIKSPLGLHTLRHSIATHLFEKGMNLNSVSSFLGHSNLDSTQIYTHLIYQKGNKNETVL